MSTTDTTPPGMPAGENYSANEKATPGDRVLAALIDWGITIPIAFIPCLGAIVCIAYGLTKDALPFLGGQSIGKKLMKIRAVTDTGESLSGNWGPAMLRQVVFFIPLFVFVELVVLLTNKDVLRFGDQWAKTKVVKVAK
jgi:uncharacterized RDD family membrane protein YckC